MRSEERSSRTLLVLVLLVLGACTSPRTPPPLGAVATPVVEPPARPRRAIPASGTHVVQPGETLSEIAWTYRLGTQSLARANNVSDPDSIMAGKRLYLRWSHPTQVAEAPARRDEAGRGTGTGRGPLRIVFVALPTSVEPAEPLRVHFDETPGGPDTATAASDPLGAIREPGTDAQPAIDAEFAPAAAIAP